MSQHGPGGLGLASALIPIWAAIVIGLWSNMVDNTDAPAEQRIAAIKVGTYTILAALQMVCGPRNIPQTHTHRKVLIDP